MIKVLVVNIQPSGGGAETVLNNLKDAIGAGNRRLQVDSFSKREFDAAHGAGSKLARYLRFVLAIRARSSGYDFVVSGVEGVPFILCLAAAFGLRGTRAIMWLHCSTDGYLKFQGVKSRLIIRLSLQLAKRVICAAPAEARRLIAGSKQAVYLPNIRRRGVAAASPMVTRILPKLAFIGSFAPLKQPEKVLDVLGVLLRMGAGGYRVDYFGNGALVGDVERQIAARGLAAQVALHGFVADPWAHIEPGSILLLPSLTEAMPMVVLEAIERGCVVIANKFPGHEFFDDHGGLFLSADYANVDRVAALVADAVGWSANEILTRTSNSRAFLSREFDNARSIDILHGYLTAMAPPLLEA